VDLHQSSGRPPGTMPPFPPQGFPGTAPSAATPVAPGQLPAPSLITGAAGAEARPQRKPRWAGIIAVLVLAGAGGLGGGGYGLFHELTRGPTHAELTRASGAEQAQRWQELPAGRIFPAAIPYLGKAGNTKQARRVGVLPAGSCGSAADPVAARVLESHGCRAVLRATYLDPSETVLVTIGVAVMPSPAAAGSTALPARAGVLPAGFAGTIASRFGGAKQLAYDSFAGPGRYLVMAAVGYADGRAATEMPYAVPDLVSAVEVRVQDTLTASVPPCSVKDVRC